MQNVIDHIRTFKDRFSLEDNEYSRLIAKKREWEPSKVSPFEPGSISEARLDCLKRLTALALRLELQVGDWVTSALPTVPDSARYALCHNAQDEITHDQAFNNMAEGLGGIPEKYLQEAEYMRQMVQEMNHPLMMTAYLELSVFFVTLTMMREYGNHSIKLLMSDIARDEAAHVRLHWHLSDQMGLKPTAQMDKARQEIITWLYPTPGRTQQKWLDNSDKLASTRTAPDLTWTKAALAVAHFEVPNESIARY